MEKGVSSLVSYSNYTKGGYQPLAIYGNRLYNRIMSLASNLYRLQEVDQLLDKSRKRIDEINRIINENSELMHAQQSLDAANLIFLQDQRQLQQAEKNTRELKIKIEQTEANLYGGKVRNPKELQDLQAESAALKRHLITLEDRELEAMLNLENSEQQISKTIEELKIIQEKLSTQSAILNGELLTIHTQVERLETERRAASSMIEENVLMIYEHLRVQRRGIAVAKAVDKSCSACGSALTPSLIQQATSSQILVRCPTCGRIIYPG